MKYLYVPLVLVLLPGQALAAGPAPMMTSLLQMFWALLVVLGILLLLFALSRRYLSSMFDQKGEIKVLERRFLQAKSSLILVQVRDTTLLLGVGGNRINVLARFPEQQQPESDFQTLLNKQT